MFIPPQNYFSYISSAQLKRLTVDFSREDNDNLPEVYEGN